MNVTEFPAWRNVRRALVLSVERLSEMMTAITTKDELWASNDERLNALNRLRLQANTLRAQDAEAGIAAGREWGKTAELAQLRKLAAFVGESSFADAVDELSDPAESLGEPAVRLRAMLNLNGKCWQEMSEQGLIYSAGFLEGFIEGAIEIFEDLAAEL